MWLLPNMAIGIYNLHLYGGDVLHVSSALRVVRAAALGLSIIVRRVTRLQCGCCLQHGHWHLQPAIVHLMLHASPPLPLLPLPPPSQALNPYWIFHFFGQHGHSAWAMLTGVTLSVSGTETMCASMGHFTRKAVTVRGQGLMVGGRGQRDGEGVARRECCGLLAHPPPEG